MSYKIYYSHNFLGGAVTLSNIQASIQKEKQEDDRLKANIPIVYEFKLNYGGIGDFIKYMKASVKKSKDMNAEFYINLDHPMNEFIKIKDKYIFNPQKTKVYEIIKPFMLYYKRFSLDDFFFEPLQYFTFSKDCLDNCSNLLLKGNINSDYEGIHLRLGDSNMKYTNIVKEDDRAKGVNFNEIVGKIVSSKKDTIFLLFSDNEQVKTEIFKTYDNVRILDIEIIHTGDHSKTKVSSQCLKDNISEFVILSKAKKIHSVTYSGYSIVASWIYLNPYVNYY